MCDVQRKEQSVKQAKLTAAELFATRLAVGDAGNNFTTSAQKWLLECLVNRVVDNLQITIREVHIRYEDHESLSRPFCAGFTFEYLHARSKDNSGKFYLHKQHVLTVFADFPRASTPKRGQDSKFHKLIQLNNVAVYWNPILTSGAISACYTAFIGRSLIEMDALMSKTTFRRKHLYADSPRHHFLLHPVDVTAHLSMQRNPMQGGSNVRNCPS
jgi:hypothetical protein